MGACAVSCGGGATNCAGTCANLATDVANCGTCGNACPSGTVCSRGTCAVSCLAGLTNCSGVCRDLLDDRLHCGACGVVCASGQVCSAGVCAVTCVSGTSNCAGVCRDLTSDNNHCGRCGTACSAGQVCSAGACAVSCVPGTTNCSGVCRDLATDSYNCGACGVVCASGQACSAGLCAVRCVSGTTNCAGVCRDLASDNNNCGRCGTVCSAGQVCASGACAVSCGAGTTNCSGACVSLATDPLHCGSCTTVCPSVHGASYCAASVCHLICDAGYRVLSGQCVATSTVPRLIAPLSLGDVTQRRPTLRWELPSLFDGAVVELCRDRACATVIETLTVSGSSARPTADLPAGAVVFWRVRGRIGTVSDTLRSATWLFHVPARSARTAVDTSSTPHLDINGDGYDDVVVGAYFSNPGGRTAAGTVSVFLGSAAGIAATAASVLEGALANDFFGYSVANAGDVNGDGYADVVVGARGASPGGRSSAGVAKVFLGSATGIQAAPSWVYEGTDERDAFGTSVASAGDLDGDGYADIVIGAPGASPGLRNAAGTASVFRGSATGTERTVARVLEGSAPLDYFGISVASAGDVNGDGHADLVVGAFASDPGGRLAAGTASVFLGSPSGISATAVQVFEGGAADDYFGSSVASAGDVNGDGYADVVVGAMYASPGRRGSAGAASVFLGSATGIAERATRVLEGVSSGDFFGRSVASAGDVNGDGYADVVVGAENADLPARTNAGTATVFFGSATGVALTPTRVLEGQAANNGLGRSVAGAGDVNGDGYADIVAGAPGFRPSGIIGAGGASLFLGDASGGAVTPSSVLYGTAQGDNFGWSVASASVRPVLTRDPLSGALRGLFSRGRDRARVL